MDNAFQELDYSDISAKHLKKKKRGDDINTRTRGGIIRLGSLIIITLIIIYLIFGIISKNKMIIKKKGDLDSERELLTYKEKAYKDEQDKNNYLENELIEVKMNIEKYSKQKSDLDTSIQNLENSNTQGEKDIKNAKDNISNLENKLKEFEEYKSKIDELQKNTEYYQKEIEKIKKELQKDGK